MERSIYIFVRAFSSTSEIYNCKRSHVMIYGTQRNRESAYNICLIYIYFLINNLKIKDAAGRVGLCVRARACPLHAS